MQMALYATGLSILEQCISTGEKRITRDDVAEMLGTAGEEVMIELTDLVMKADMSSALLLLDSAMNSGRDVKQFMKEWLAHFRNLLMAKYIQNPESALNMSLENVERVRKQSAEISTDLLNRGITELTKTISESRWSAQPRVMLEMCIVRLGVGQEELKQTVFRYDGQRLLFPTAELYPEERRQYAQHSRPFSSRCRTTDFQTRTLSAEPYRQRIRKRYQYDAARA